MFIHNKNLRKSLGMSRLMAPDNGVGSGKGEEGVFKGREEKEGDDIDAGEERTFTQSDIDKIVKDRLARSKKDQPSKEELKAFKQWKEEQNANEEKNTAKVSLAEQKLKDAEAKASSLEAKVSCLSRGVKADSVDDVVTLAKAMINDETPIEKAIDLVLKKYPLFKEGQEEGQKGFKVGASAKVNVKNADNELKKIFGIKNKDN